MHDTASVAMMSSRIKELEEASTALVRKIEKIIVDHSYRSLFDLAAIHGNPYTGPNFGDELDHLIEVLGLTPGDTGDHDEEKAT